MRPCEAREKKGSIGGFGGGGGRGSGSAKPAKGGERARGPSPMGRCRCLGSEKKVEIRLAELVAEREGGFGIAVSCQDYILRPDPGGRDVTRQDNWAV